MTRKLTGLGLAFARSHGAKVAAARPRQLLAPDATGTVSAGVEILVGNQFGRVLAELRPALNGAAWKLNNYGQARMVLSRRDALARQDMLQFGNRLLIRFGNGLPNWGGVIDTPRRWRDGKLEIVAYSGEWLLGTRITDRGRYFARATVGEIFTQLIREAVPFGMRVGEVWQGGGLHGPDYHLDDLLGIVQKSLAGRLEGADWDVTAELEAGQIVFAANLYSRRGVDHGRQLALVDGVNTTPAGLNEQGRIVNELHLAGAGTGWGAESRIYSLATDGGSAAQFGLRQWGSVEVDIKQQETLDSNAAVALAEGAWPREVVSMEALDRAPARFGDYDVGDSLAIEIAEAGWNGYVGQARVVAREFLPESNRCSLVLE